MANRFERFTYAIFEISKHWHKIAAEEMEKYGLKGPHAVYLVTIQRHPEGLTAAKLCELCSRDKSDVSRAVSLMEKKGLIIKKEVYQNKYRALLKLTETGALAAKQVRKRAEMVVNLAGEGISDQNREIFYDTLELITNNLQTISKEGLPQS